MLENTKTAKKSKGRVYTPDYIVKNILEMTTKKPKTNFGFYH